MALNKQEKDQIFTQLESGENLRVLLRTAGLAKPGIERFIRENKKRIKNARALSLHKVKNIKDLDRAIERLENRQIKIAEELVEVTDKIDKLRAERGTR